MTCFGNLARSARRDFSYSSLDPAITKPTNILSITTRLVGLFR
jgi:hypothetical protein